MECEFLNKKGNIKEYYDNGQIKLEVFTEVFNGKIESRNLIKFLFDLLNEKIKLKIEGKIYYENNKLAFEGELLNGGKLKGKFYNKNSELEFDVETELLNGQNEQEKIKGYDSEAIKNFIIELSNGRINSKINQKIYHSNGKIKFETEFLNGKLKIKKFNENGQLELEENSPIGGTILILFTETFSEYYEIVLVRFLINLVLNESKKNEINENSKLGLRFIPELLLQILKEKNDK